MNLSQADQLYWKRTLGYSKVEKGVQAANQYDWFVVPFYPLEPLTVRQDVGNALYPD
ncbi:hypothetical protein PENSUB_4168 [Penicillium subrubescens]|uniref:Uncharacterized protein n=1 Tax=Penicillium subrubescens TaxID=1316194 RepID=A0A1Q5UD43_9EURO|nr:hypothetical protein PENSUB_4168 [Penicillium subrubescens]